MEKKLYTAPEIEIVGFDTRDIMTTSEGIIDEIEGNLGGRNLLP